MHSPRKLREDDGKHVIKSCRNLVQTEIRMLRDNMNSMRGFLRGCQDTINAETAKLENKCLVKIQSLESEKLSLERELGRMKDENEHLRASCQQSASKMTQLDKDSSQNKKEIAELSGKVKSLKSQLGTKADRCADLHKSLEDAKMKSLALENKLASNEAYVKEQKEVLHEMATDRKLLESSASDLKLRAAESEVYEKALEGHVAELEAICSILREQHDEQQKYFVQKETIFKRDAKEKQRTLQNENKKLTERIQELEFELRSEKSKLQKQAETSEKTEKALKEKEETAAKLVEKSDSAHHKLQIERATVEMLTRKNNDLSQDVLKAQNKLDQSEEKLSTLSISDGNSVDRKALAEIGNTVQQYLEGNTSLAKKLESSLVVSNNDMLEECEKQLEYERKHRLTAEMEVSHLSVELEKAKVEIAIYRSSANRSFRSADVNGRRRIHYNSFSCRSGLSEYKNPALGLCNQQYSELLSKVPTPSSTVQELRHNVQSLGECNGLNTPSIIVNGESVVAEEAHSEHAQHSSQGDTPEINSILSASEISDPVSQKMEEATRKALAMLNNSS